MSSVHFILVGCLAQLCGDQKKPIQGSVYTKQYNGMPQNPLFHGCPTKNPCRKKTVGYQPIHQPSQPTHQPSKPIHFGDPCVPRGFLQIGDDDDVAELREGDELEVG